MGESTEHRPKHPQEERPTGFDYLPLVRDRVEDWEGYQDLIKMAELSLERVQSGRAVLGY